MNYFSRKIDSIEFLGSVINVCNGIVRVYFKQARCSCRVYLRLENSGYEKEYFTVNKEIIVSLAEYDHVNNIIFVRSLAKKIQKILTSMKCSVIVFM